MIGWRGLERRERVVAVVAGALLLLFAVDQLGALLERRRRDVLRQDLRSLAVAQESYYYDHRVYGADPAEVRSWGFEPSAKAAIDVVEATRDGWSAVAVHAASDTRCYLVIRGAAPLGPATEDGVVQCG